MSIFFRVQSNYIHLDRNLHITTSISTKKKSLYSFTCMFTLKFIFILSKQRQTTRKPTKIGQFLTQVLITNKPKGTKVGTPRHLVLVYTYLGIQMSVTLTCYSTTTSHEVTLARRTDNLVKGGAVECNQYNIDSCQNLWGSLCPVGNSGATEIMMIEIASMCA